MHSNGTHTRPGAMAHLFGHTVPHASMLPLDFWSHSHGLSQAASNSVNISGARVPALPTYQPSTYPGSIHSASTNHVNFMPLAHAPLSDSQSRALQETHPGNVNYTGQLLSDGNPKATKKQKFSATTRTEGGILAMMQRMFPFVRGTADNPLVWKLGPMFDAAGYCMQMLGVHITGLPPMTEHTEEIL